MSLNQEVYLHWYRTPDHLRFIRSIRAPEGFKPGRLSLPDRECLGHTLRADGSVCRAFYVRVDVARDGLLDFEPDPNYPKATAGSPKVKLKQSLLPVSDEEVPAVVALDEELQRAPIRKHWSEWHAAKAEERRLQKQKANEEHEAWVKQQQALAGIITKPRHQPKKSIFARLFG